MASSHLRERSSSTPEFTACRWSCESSAEPAGPAKPGEKASAAVRPTTRNTKAQRRQRLTGMRYSQFTDDGKWRRTHLRMGFEMAVHAASARPDCAVRRV